MSNYKPMNKSNKKSIKKLSTLIKQYSFIYEMVGKYKIN